MNKKLTRILRKYQRGVFTFEETIDCVITAYHDADMPCTRLMAQALMHDTRNHKQALIENVLGIWLDSDMLNYLEENWRAFCRDPYKYKDTIVPTLILKDLGYGMVTLDEEEPTVGRVTLMKNGVRLAE